MTVDVKALRELLAKATPGEWVADAYQQRVRAGDTPEGEGVVVAELQQEADAALIAALVNAAPELLDRLEALENRLNTYQREWHEMEAVADAARAQWQDADARHHETLKRAADLEAKLAAAEAAADEAWAKRRLYFSERNEAMTKALQGLIAAYETESPDADTAIDVAIAIAREALRRSDPSD